MKTRDDLKIWNKQKLWQGHLQKTKQFLRIEIQANRKKMLANFATE